MRHWVSVLNFNIGQYSLKNDNPLYQRLIIDFAYLNFCFEQCLIELKENNYSQTNGKSKQQAHNHIITNGCLVVLVYMYENYRVVNHILFIVGMVFLIKLKVG